MGRLETFSPIFKLVFPNITVDSLSREGQVGEVYVVGPDGAEAGEDLREGGDDEVLRVDLAGDGGSARDGPGRVDLVLRVRPVEEGLPPLSPGAHLLHGCRAGLQDQAAHADADPIAQLVRRVVHIEAGRKRDISTVLLTQD